ncbi:MAG: hypothetical protein IJZ29_00610 [Clostridia bacterium]|nr:hypothetical protein [Clostridia bacterium]
MSTKQTCPHCGRVVCISKTAEPGSDANSKVLCEQPKTLKKNQVVQGIKCIKCKKIVYVLTEV